MYIILSGMKIKCFYFLASEMSESSDEDGIIDNISSQYEQLREKRKQVIENRLLLEKLISPTVQVIIILIKFYYPVY